MYYAHHMFHQMTHQMGNWDNLDIEQGDATTWLPESHMIPDGYEVFAEMPTEVVWDEDVHNIVDHNSLLKQLGLGTDNFQLAYGEEYLEDVCSVFDEGSQMDALWDVQMQSDKGMHEGLLQQLASGQEYFDSEQLAVREEMHQGSKDLTGKEKQLTADFSHASGASLLVELNIDCVVLDEMHHKDVVWDEDLSSALDIQHGSVRQSAYLVGEESKLINESVIDDVLTQDNCSSFILDAGIDVSNADKRLELKVIDDDKLYKEMFFKANGNLQLAEHGAGFACVGQAMDCDHQNRVLFDGRQEKGSAQYVIAKTPLWSFTLKIHPTPFIHENEEIVAWDTGKFWLSLAQHDINGHIICKLHHVLGKCNLWHGQHDSMPNYGCKELLHISSLLPTVALNSSKERICSFGFTDNATECSGKFHLERQYVGHLTKLQPLIFMEHGFSQIPTWRFDGFNTRKGQRSKRLLSMDFSRQINDQTFKSTLLVGASMVCMDYKRAAIFVRTVWDPGIWRFLIRELVLECSMWMTILLLSRWTPSHKPDKLFIKRFCVFISWPLMDFLRDGYALHRVVYCLYTSLAWGQASFSGGGNVMTLVWTGKSKSREPSCEVTAQPAQERQGQEYNRNYANRGRIEQFILNRTQRDGKSFFLLRLRGHYPLDLPCDCSRSRD